MKNWMTTVAGQSLGNFETTPELDRELSQLALAARSDASERDRLYVLLAAKIERFAARFRSWRLEPFTIDDVQQETYLVFAAIIDAWTPRHEAGRPFGFLYFFLKIYPLRLSDAVSDMIGRRQPAPLVLPDGDRDPPDCSLPEGEAIVSAIVDDLCTRLTSEQAMMLRLRVASGRSLPQVANELGLARRTAYRRWHNIIEIGRRYWEEAS